MVLRLSEACEPDSIACVCGDEPNGEHFCKVAVEADREEIAKELRRLAEALHSWEGYILGEKANKGCLLIYHDLLELSEQLEGK